MAVEPQGCTPVPYRPRRPSTTVLYQVVQAHFETYLALCSEGNWDNDTVPGLCRAGIPTLPRMRHPRPRLCPSAV